VPWLIDGYDAFVIDIYSCDRSWLVIEVAVVERETEVVSEMIFPRL